MTMAEKQYKNYDERFLKEDTSSGSRPVIEYDESNNHEVRISDSGTIMLKGKFSDGSYCQNAEDLKTLLTSGALIFFSGENGNKAIFLPSYLAISKTATVLMSISPENLVQIVDASYFDQIQ